MFQNLLISPIVPLGRAEEIKDWENQPFRTVWPETQHITRKEPEIRKTIKKKPKRFRTAFSTEQLRVLEKTFCVTKYIDAENRRKLSESLKISDKSIKVWFQNRRVKEKRDSDSWDDSAESFAASPPLNIHGPQASNIMYEHLELQNQNMPGLDTNNSILPSTYDSNYIPNHQAPGYEAQYQEMVPNHVSFLEYNADYPTEYNPNHNENINDYNQGGVTHHVCYWNEYNGAGNTYDNYFT